MGDYLFISLFNRETPFQVKYPYKLVGLSLMGIGMDRIP